MTEPCKLPESKLALRCRLDLLNETPVATAIAHKIETIDTAPGPVALYAEREIAQAKAS